MIDLLKTHLYYTAFGSDKEYIALLACTDKENNLYTVSAQYGPRGQAYNDTVKIRNATYELAKKEFLALLKSKIKKGYTTDVSGYPSSKANWQNEIDHVLLSFQFENVISGVKKKKHTL